MSRKSPDESVTQLDIPITADITDKTFLSERDTRPFLSERDTRLSSCDVDEPALLDSVMTEKTPTKGDGTLADLHDTSISVSNDDAVIHIKEPNVIVDETRDRLLPSLIDGSNNNTSDIKLMKSLLPSISPQPTSSSSKKHRQEVNKHIPISPETKVSHKPDTPNHKLVIDELTNKIKQTLFSKTKRTHCHKMMAI
jgi:hypothetical protein